MSYLIISTLILLIILAIILCWLNIPGSFILLLSTLLFEWLYNNFEVISIVPFLIILIILIFLEIIEFVLSSIAIKVYGGKTSSAFLSILGGFVGAITLGILVPIIGGLIGLIAGTYLVTYFNEKKSGKTHEEAIRIANSSTLGYVAAKAIKTMSIVIMGLYFIWEYYYYYFIGI